MQYGRAISGGRQLTWPAFLATRSVPELGLAAEYELPGLGAEIARVRETSKDLAGTSHRVTRWSSRGVLSRRALSRRDAAKRLLRFSRSIKLLRRDLGHLKCVPVVLELVARTHLVREV